MDMRTILMALLIQQVCGSSDRDFPPGFRFGASTSAYQVEGAWNASDKSESIWDRLAHTPGIVGDGTDGDTAANSYHNAAGDIEMTRQLGLHFYHFSISWPRLLPEGFDNKVSEDGVRYYNRLIDGLLAVGVEPMVTIYHWDLPQVLQDLGGWQNPLIVDWFEDYARVVFNLYADRVKTWITVNEPQIICTKVPPPYEVMVSAMPVPGADEYMCSKNLLMAHANVYRLYDEKYRDKHGGKVGMSDLYVWLENKTNTREERRLIDLANELYNGMYSHAVYSKAGGWPKAIEDHVANHSKRQGYKVSRLPKLTSKEIDHIRGTYDFVGFNFYVTKYIRYSNKTFWPLLSEIGADFYSDPSWTDTPKRFFEIYPQGIRKMLKYIKRRYNNPLIFIIENGCPSRSGIVDTQRVQFLKDYLSQVLDAIYLDGVNMTHYAYWSLMDTFQWIEGYSVSFGLYEVDFRRAQRPRRARKSALYYTQIIKGGSLNFNETLIAADNTKYSH